MAGYCHGTNAPYGCGHHAEHVEAAKKGWATRRRHQRGATFEGSEEQYYASGFLGEQISYAHTHPEHRGRVVFKSKGKWYELPKRTFDSYVKGGRKLEREEQKRAEARQRSQARANQRASVNELKFQIANERQVTNYTRAQRADVVKFIKAQTGGGIAPDRKQGRYRGNRQEWLGLPSNLRNTKSRFTLDQATELVAESYPELQIEDSNDLLRFFERSDYQRQQSTSRRRSLQQELASVRPTRKRKAS